MQIATTGKRPRVFGAILGIGAVLFIESALYLWSDHVLMVLLLLALLVLLIPVGIICGVLLARQLPPVPWWAALVTAIVGWPILACAPLGMRTAQLHWIAYREFPVLPGAEKLSTVTKSMPPAEAVVTLRTAERPEKVLQFYRQEFTRRGCLVEAGAEMPLPFVSCQKKDWIEVSVEERSGWNEIQIRWKQFFRTH